MPVPQKRERKKVGREREKREDFLRFENNLSAAGKSLRRGRSGLCPLLPTSFLQQHLCWVSHFDLGRGGSSPVLPHICRVSRAGKELQNYSGH
jgi:hypothetical protein